MEQAQRDKEKEKKKRSKANKKAKDEKDAQTAAQAALDKVAQKAEAVRDSANRAVGNQRKHCSLVYVVCTLRLVYTHHLRPPLSYSLALLALCRRWQVCVPSAVRVCTE